MWGNQVSRGAAAGEPVESRVALRSSSNLDHEGRNYTAARAGQELAMPVRVTLSYWLADPWIRYDLNDPDDELAPPVQAATTGQWVRTEGTVDERHGVRL